MADTQNDPIARIEAALERVEAALDRPKAQGAPTTTHDERYAQLRERTQAALASLDSVIARAAAERR